MNELQSSTLTVIAMKHMRVWTRRVPDPYRLDVELFVRTPCQNLYYLNGIYHTQEPTLHELCTDAFRLGVYSVRPFNLKNDPDRSCVYCVMALLLHFCECKAIDPVIFANLQHAYKEPFGFPEEDVLAQARWEGVTFPTRWNVWNTRRLMEALRALQLLPFVHELERVGALTA